MLIVRLFIFSGSILCSFVSCAATADPSGWPEGSAMHSGLAQKKILEKKAEKATDIINNIRAWLTQHQPYNGKQLSELFQQHHDDWLSYIDATCRLVGESTGAGGSWPSYYALACKTNMVDQRLFKLTNTLQCIKRHVKNQTPDTLSSCLYQSYSVEY